VSTGRLEFDRLQKEAAALIDIEKEDLIDFWRRIYSADGRRVLVTQVIPRQGPASSKLPPTSTGYGTSKFTDLDLFNGTLVLGVDDIQQFRQDREKEIEEEMV
jgi:hypothetical protein